MKKENYTKYAKRFLVFWLPLIIWAIIIFGFSANPTTQVSEVRWQDFVFKKFVHVVEYGVLATLIYRAFVNSGVDKKKAGYWAAGLAIIYGITDEFHQSYTPTREPTLRDVIFDTIGALLAVYSIWYLLPKAPKKLKSLAKKLQLT